LQAKVEAELAARTTFRVVADEFIEKMEREAKAPATLKKARYAGRNVRWPDPGDSWSCPLATDRSDLLTSLSPAPNFVTCPIGSGAA